MEKANSIETGQPQAHRRKGWLQLLLLAAIVILLQAGAYARFAAIWKPHQHATVRKYAGETIEWKACGENDGYELECSSLDVPMDHFDAANSGTDTFTIPLIRIRGKSATKNQLVNPGGPGASGINYIYRGGKKLKTIVGENYHILGFDPRGVNGSRPAALCYPDQEARKKLSPVRDSDPVRDGPEVYAWAENFAQACIDTSGRHAEYINTPQTAADMNNILDAVGQDGMAYWGLSYGTTLGQTYATMFPERSERVIIDGVSNHFHHYESLINPSSYMDSEKVLAGFFDECIKAGDDCALSQLADTGSELQSKVMDFIWSLKRRPFSVYLDNTSYGALDAHTMLFAIFSNLYKPEGWYKLADELAQLMQGNGTAAFLAYGVDDGDTMYSEHNKVIHNNDAIAGKDNWPQNDELLDLLLPTFNQSMFAYERFVDYYVRSLWRLPKRHSYKPQRSVKTTHPLLILSQSFDPICPLASARVAKSIFEGSRIVQVMGYGHCSVATQSSCTARHIRDFLDSGVLPLEDVECEVDGPYFLSPERKSQILSAGTAKGASSEEQILAAQLGLASEVVVG